MNLLSSQKWAFYRLQSELFLKEYKENRSDLRPFTTLDWINLNKPTVTQNEVQYVKHLLIRKNDTKYAETLAFVDDIGLMSDLVHNYHKKELYSNEISTEDDPVTVVKELLRPVQNVDVWLLDNTNYNTQRPALDDGYVTRLFVYVTPQNLEHQMSVQLFKTMQSNRQRHY